ncbi:hypothetical protein N7U66_17690 [Lacinutrix neustonica]|uniref:Membrane or secreted protein n=1 Tax=Lacinutrix neustonica TaxID=2980107 RepID=A0A9E8SCU5_9FLAO|nr:hypothetical protein [Lacinutrix neustonica]WAC01713.1 hypothetical protein N7U66_17690 [Lacinutrix neustonica]
MKKVIFTVLAVAFMSFSFTSCREEEKKTETQELIEEMEAEGADIETKVDGDETKIKMETEDKEVKIKTDGGDTKIKVDED